MTSYDDGFVACPANNCERGEVLVSEWRDGDGGPAVEAGHCDLCGAASVRCSDCGDVTLFVDGDERQCDGCEAVYQQVLDRKGLLSSFRRIS